MRNLRLDPFAFHDGEPHALHQGRILEIDNDTTERALRGVALEPRENSISSIYIVTESVPQPCKSLAARPHSTDWIRNSTGSALVHFVSRKRKMGNSPLSKT